MPWSMPWRIRYGPARTHRVVRTIRALDRHSIRRYGCSIRAARRTTWTAAARSRRSCSSTPDIDHISGHPRRSAGEDLAVALVGGEELGVGAGGRDPAAVEQDDAIGERDGGRPVGDDDRGAVAHDL